MLVYKGILIMEARFVEVIIWIWYLTACHPTCQTCSIGSSTGCNTCGAENLRIFLTSNNTCSCKPGYVDIGFPKCSIVCDVTCQTCYDFSSQGCLTCNNLYPHFRYISTKNIC